MFTLREKKKKTFEYFFYFECRLSNKCAHLYLNKIIFSDSDLYKVKYV